MSKCVFLKISMAATAFWVKDKPVGLSHIAVMVRITYLQNIYIGSGK